MFNYKKRAELLKKVKKGDIEAKKELAMSYLSNIRDIVKKLKIPKEYEEDAIQSGMLGVLEAIESSDCLSIELLSDSIRYKAITSIEEFLISICLLGKPFKSNMSISEISFLISQMEDDFFDINSADTEDKKAVASLSKKYNFDYPNLLSKKKDENIESVYAPSYSLEDHALRNFDYHLIIEGFKYLDDKEKEYLIFYFGLFNHPKLNYTNDSIINTIKKALKKLEGYYNMRNGIQKNYDTEFAGYFYEMLFKSYENEFKVRRLLTFSKKFVRDLKTNKHYIKNFDFSFFLYFFENILHIEVFGSLFTEEEWERILPNLTATDQKRTFQIMNKKMSELYESASFFYVFLDLIPRIYTEYIKLKALEEQPRR